MRSTTPRRHDVRRVTSNESTMALARERHDENLVAHASEILGSPQRAGVKVNPRGCGKRAGANVTVCNAGVVGAAISATAVGKANKEKAQFEAESQTPQFGRLAWLAVTPRRAGAGRVEAEGAGRARAEGCDRPCAAEGTRGSGARRCGDHLLAAADDPLQGRGALGARGAAARAQTGAGGCERPTG